MSYTCDGSRSSCPSTQPEAPRPARLARDWPRSSSARILKHAGPWSHTLAVTAQLTCSHQTGCSSLCAFYRHRIVFTYHTIQRLRFCAVSHYKTTAYKATRPGPILLSPVGAFPAKPSSVGRPPNASRRQPAADSLSPICKFPTPETKLRS